MNFLARYNAMQHRCEPHSRVKDWLENLPPSGVRAICSWELFSNNVGPFLFNPNFQS